MRLRGLLALLVLTASLSNASAAEQGPLRRVSCAVVRYYVAKYSVAAAESWARNKGATEAEIESARHCLKGGTFATVQSAQNQ
jgi:hypothetical protein